jgi:hypothetical protein
MFLKFYTPAFIILLSICSQGFAQDTALDRFTGAESKGRVFLEWVISAGNTCQGIRILRSTDSLHFIQIGDIGGVCGSITVPTTYTFTDDHPVKNKTNYYQLELGGIGLSSVVVIKVIDFGKNGYQIIPNPVTDNARIFFSNDTRQYYELNVFTLQGALISTLHTTQNVFEITKMQIQSGLLFFTITSPGSAIKIKGKMVVLH